MNKLKLPSLFLMALTSFTSLEAKSLKHPQLVDFTIPPLNMEYINYSPACRSKFGEAFNEKLCTKTDFRCDIKEIFHQKEKKPVQVTLDAKLQEYLSVRRQHTLYFSMPGEQVASGHAQGDSYIFSDHHEGFSFGSKAHFYVSVMHEAQIEIIDLGDAEIQDQVQLNQFEIPERKLRLIRGDGFGEYEQLMAKIDNTAGIMSIHGNVFEIFMKPGAHELTIMNHQKKFVKKFTLQKGNEAITYHAKDFNVFSEKERTVAFQDQKQLEWSRRRREAVSDYGDSFSLRMRTMNDETLLQKIDSLKLIGANGKVVDGIDIFSFHLLGFSVKNEKTLEYEKALKELGTFTLELKAMCEKATVRPSVVEYPIYESPAENSKALGKMLVSYNRKTTEGKIEFRKPDNSTIPYQLNFANERCNSGMALLQLVTEQEKDFVNLGKGPWGDHGWTKIPTLDPISSAYKFSFSGFNQSTIKLSRNKGQIDVVGWNSEENSNIKRTIEEKELWESESRISFKCSDDGQY